MSKMIKWLFTILLAIIVVAVLAVAFVPASVFKPWIEKAATGALDREVRITGDLSWRVWPPLAIELRGFELANLPGREPAQMVKAESASIDIDALAYLQGILRINELVLDQPLVHLQRDAEGRANWEFGGAASAPASDDTDSSESIEVPELSIGQIAFNGGQLRFVDDQSGLDHSVNDLDLSVSQNQLETVLSATALFNAEKVKADAVVTDLQSLFGGGASSELTVATPFANLNSGGLARLESFSDAKLALELTDLNGLLAWLGIDAELPPELPKAGKIGAEFDASASQVLVHSLRLDAKPLHLSGDLNAEFSKRPRISAVLESGPLDLSPYIQTDQSNPEEAQQAESEPWPDDPIAWQLPLPLDLDLSLAFPSLKAQELETGPGAISVYSDNLNLRAEISDLQLYDGTVSSSVKLDEFADAPNIGLVAEASQVDVLPLLGALAQFERLEGAANIKANLRTKGASIKAMIEALNGDGELLFRDGAILGINIAGMMRQVASLGLDRDAAQERRTDFAELGGSFSITDGLISNDDFQLRAPVLRVFGAGTVDLPGRFLDYAVTPRLSATLEGQDADSEPAVGAGIPLVFSGPWVNPQFQLAIGGTLSGDLRDPENMARLVGQLGQDPQTLLALREQFGAGGSVLEELGGLLDGQGSIEATPLDGQAEEAVDEIKNKVDQLKEGLGKLLDR